MVFMRITRDSCRRINISDRKWAVYFQGATNLMLKFMTVYHQDMNLTIEVTTHSNLEFG